MKQPTNSKESEVSIGVIYNTYSPVLYKICLRYSSSKEDAEDLLHDSFMRIIEKLSQYKGQGSFEGWLKRIVVTVALNKIRQQKGHEKHTADFDEIDETEIKNINETNSIKTNKDIILDAGLRVDDVLKALQSIPEKAKLVFNLYVFEEKKHKEIAKILEITDSTSKTQLKRARQLLHEQILKESKQKMQLKLNKKLLLLPIFFKNNSVTYIDKLVKSKVNTSNITPPSFSNLGIPKHLTNTTINSSLLKQSIANKVLNTITSGIKSKLHIAGATVIVATSIITYNQLNTNKTNIINHLQQRDFSITPTINTKIDAKLKMVPTHVFFQDSTANNNESDTVTVIKKVHKIIKQK